MSFIEVVRQVGDYGLSLILSAVVVYVLIKLIHIQFDKLKVAASRKEHDQALALRSEVDEKVYDVINRFIETHHGLRLQVVEFTNTVTSVAYLPFKYMSCTYEVVSYGTKPEARCIDKLSTSLFSPFLSKLGKEEYLVLSQQTSEEISGVVHDLYEQIGGENIVCVMLKSGKAKCIGYLALFKDRPVEDRDVNDLLVVGSKLSALLGVLDK